MSILKQKGDALYRKMRASREQLVKKYEAAGSIRYDVALGIAKIDPVTGLPVTTGLTKSVNLFKEDGTSAGTLTVPDLVAIKAANIAAGIPSGTMLDALKSRAEGKVILLNANDNALRWGFCNLAEVKCLLRLETDVKVTHAGTVPAIVTNSGLVHAVPGKVETRALTFRGEFKPVNYRATTELLNDVVSIWSIKDKSGLSQSLFGMNSLIRMYGEDQIIDLAGFKISHHERPNRFAGFASIVDLADGHFSGLSTKGARNAHIYSSKGVGILGRSNHFAIRGHFVKGLLVEGVQCGDPSTINEGSYFGSFILNDCQEIVVKDVHQKMMNKAVAASSLGLSWYAALIMSEYVMAKYDTNTSFLAANYPWLKWDATADGLAGTFGNFRQTVQPVLKSEAELTTALSALGAGAATAAAKVYPALQAMQSAYYKSHKHADDFYIQVHTAFGANFVASAPGTIMTTADQIPRSTNAVVSNPKTTDGTRYPDSVSYGFRVGSAAEGVGKLAQTRGGTISDIYVMDSTFSDMHMSPMEALSLGVSGHGAFKVFNGQGLRPFGYSNSQSPAASIAAASMLLSKDRIEAVVPGAKLEVKPVDSFDTAALALVNGGSGWTAEKAMGLYKGHDVLEQALATLEAIGLLKKYFTANGPQAILNGVDNSNLDVGILAWRKSMMVALGARTASQIGLKGGYNGQIFDLDQENEIYPWFVSADGSVSIDKDTEITVQQDGNINTPAQIKANRTLSQGYLGCALPAMSDSIYKLKLISADTLALVTGDLETPVTYQDCVTLLGFDKTTFSPASLSAPVQYKILRNFDGQNHVHKGSFGVRVDEASNVLVKNVISRDFDLKENNKPNQSLGSQATQVAFGVNAEQRPESGVCEVHGVSLNGVTDGCIEDIIVEGATIGSIIAVDIAGRSSKISINNVLGESLEAGSGGALIQPFGEQKALGLRVEEGCTEIEVKGIKVDSLITSRKGLGKIVEIESDDVKVD